MITDSKWNRLDFWKYEYIFDLHLKINFENFVLKYTSPKIYLLVMVWGYGKLPVFHIFKKIIPLTKNGKFM